MRTSGVLLARLDSMLWLSNWGYDFFNVVDPRYYGDRWLEFIGNLYSEIDDGKYAPSPAGGAVLHGPNPGNFAPRQGHIAVFNHWSVHSVDNAVDGWTPWGRGPPPP